MSSLCRNKRETVTAALPLGLMHNNTFRQDQVDFQAWFIVCKPNFAVVQPRYRSNEAEAQAGARFGPAFLKPHEAFEDALPIDLGNAGPAVGNRDSPRRRRGALP